MGISCQRNGHWAAICQSSAAGRCAGRGCALTRQLANICNRKYMKQKKPKINHNYTQMQELLTEAITRISHKPYKIFSISTVNNITSIVFFGGDVHFCYFIITLCNALMCYLRKWALYKTFNTPFKVIQGHLSIKRSYSEWTSKLRTAKFGDNKLETALYRMCQKYFDILNRLGVTHECDRQTDGRTDEQTDKQTRHSKSSSSSSSSIRDL